MNSEKECTISNYDDLIATLKKELGYCGCGYYEEAILLLYDTLRLARIRTDTINSDNECYLDATDELLERIPLNKMYGLATWFLYLLNDRDLITHGFEISDIMITQKGRWLLDAIERYYPLPEKSG